MYLQIRKTDIHEPTPDDDNTSPVMVDADQKCVTEQNHADGDDSGERVHASVIHDHSYETPHCTEEGNAQLWTTMSDV